MPDISLTPDSWFNNTPLIVALVALLSTLLGATIGAGTTYILAKRKEEADAAAEERRNSIEVKRAARLVYMELLRGYAFAKAVMDNRRWTTLKIKTDSWTKHAHLLAPVLSDKEWYKLCVAEDTLDHLIEMRNLALSDSPTRMHFDESQVPMFELYRDLIDAGRKALRRWSFTDTEGIP